MYIYIYVHSFAQIRIPKSVLLKVTSEEIAPGSGFHPRLGQLLLPLKTRSRLMSRSQQILHQKLRYSLTNDGWKIIFLYKWYLFGWDVNSWGVVSKPIFFIVSLLKRPSFKFIFSKREDWVTDMFQVFKDPRVVFCWAPQITLLLLLGSIEVNDWSHAKKLGGLIQHFFIDGLGLGHENLNDWPLSPFCCLGILTLKVFFCLWEMFVHLRLMYQLRVRCFKLLSCFSYNVIGHGRFCLSELGFL